MLNSWHVAVFTNPRRLRLLRAAHAEWCSRCIDRIAARGLLAGARRIGAPKLKRHTVRRWREYLLAMEAKRRCDGLVHGLVHRGAAQRQLASRQAVCFARWREVGVERVPPVLKQLMRVRRRMDASGYAMYCE